MIASFSFVTDAVYYFTILRKICEAFPMPTSRRRGMQNLQSQFIYALNFDQDIQNESESHDSVHIDHRNQDNNTFNDADYDWVSSDYFIDPSRGPRVFLPPPPPPQTQRQIQEHQWPADEPIIPESSREKAARRQKDKADQEYLERRFPLIRKIYEGKGKLGSKLYTKEYEEVINFGSPCDGCNTHFDRLRYSKMLRNFYDEVDRSPFVYDEDVLLSFGSRDVGLALLSKKPGYHYHAFSHLYKLQANLS